VGRYQFTHALIQETLSEELTLTRKVRLHARIAETLEQLYGNNVEAHAAELAYHFTEAETITGTDRLVRYSGMAGRRALATYAYEEASGHFERALTAKEGAPQSTGTRQETDEETAGLLYGLGRAQLVTFQVEEGWANLTRAFDYYAEVGDIPRVVDIADYPVTVSAPGNVAPLLARALELVPPDSYEAGRLLPWHGRLLNTLQGDYEGAQDAMSRALAIAEREGDISLQMQTLAFTADMEGSNLHWNQSLDAALLAIELTNHAGNPLAEFFAHLWGARALLVTGGDSERIRLHAEAGLLAAERLHDHLWLPIALGAFNTFFYSAWGDWQAAREFSDRGLDLAPRSSLILPPRIMLEYQVGEFDRGEAFLERFLETTGVGRRAQGLVTVIPMAARISGNTDRLDIAEEAAMELLSSDSTAPLNASAARIGLALIAVQRSAMTEAAEQLAALESLRGTMSGGLALAISIDRLLGLLAHTMNNLDQACAHFENALPFCRNAGYRPELAWTCCDYADTLLQRNEPGDQEKAMSLLDESLAISNELGMRPLMERVLSRREILKA
jgi:tetratricopeptide (TPR) repeat protein